MRNLHFSTRFCHIVCAALAAQHARCHKEYYPPRRQAVSTSHFRSRAQHPFCVSKAIFLCWRPPTHQKSHLFLYFSASSRTTGATMQTFGRSMMFPYPMDRAEAVHAANYDIKLSPKKVLAKMNWFFHAISSLFHKMFPNSLRSTCHATCPLPVEYYSPRGQAASTSHII